MYSDLCEWEGYAVLVEGIIDLLADLEHDGPVVVVAGPAADDEVNRAASQFLQSHFGLG